MLMADLTWLSCPFCGEIADLHRVGQVGTVVKAKKIDHMKVLHSKRVKCGFCGKTFKTDSNTIWEAFGRSDDSTVPY